MATDGIHSMIVKHQFWVNRIESTRYALTALAASTALTALTDFKRQTGNLDALKANFVAPRKTATSLAVTLIVSDIKIFEQIELLTVASFFRRLPVDSMALKATHVPFF